MSLSDPSFIGFFVATFVLFYLLPGGMARLGLVLAVSLGFYAYIAGGYVVVLLWVAAIAFIGGLSLRGPAGSLPRRVVFWTSLLAALAPLFVFKYLAFLLDSLGVGAPPAVEHLALPVGLSFFTFAAVGYLIDINLELQIAERNPLRFGTFVSFFPLVTAGPIERGGRLLPQLDLKHKFSSDRALDALRLIFIGLVLKVLFADTLSVPVAAVFGDPDSSPPLEKFVAVVFFAFNLYTDFAGYSLIAIGCAKMLGIEVQPNFRQPFLSQSIPEFWRTWHMSLSFWVRDYLFMPLRAQWRRAGWKGMVGATLLSFTILGIWHGAGLQFALYGAAFGVLAVGSLYTAKYRDRAYAALHVPIWAVRIIRAVITFIIFSLVLVLFRANYLDDALLFYRDIFSFAFLGDVWSAIDFGLLRHGAPPEMSVMGAYAWEWLLIAVVVAGDLLVRNGYTLARFPLAVQAVVYNVGLGAIVYQWMTSSVAPPFLYYKF